MQPFLHFSSNDISSLLNEITSFSISQRSDSLLNSKIKQNFALLFILFYFFHKQDNHCNCFNLTTWIYLLAYEDIFWGGWLQSPEFLRKVNKVLNHFILHCSVPPNCYFWHTTCSLVRNKKKRFFPEEWQSAYAYPWSQTIQHRLKLPTVW